MTVLFRMATIVVLAAGLSHVSFAENKSTKAQLRATSEALKNSDYVPLISSRSIMLSLYSDKLGCPDMNREYSGLVLTHTLTKRAPGKTFNLSTSREKTYLKIESVSKTGSSIITCNLALAFRPEAGKQYDLQMGMPETGQTATCGETTIQATLGGVTAAIADLQYLEMKNANTGNANVPNGQCI